MSPNLPALQRTVSDLIAEYEAKNAAVLSEIEAFKGAIDRMKSAAVVSGYYVGPVFSDPFVRDTDVRRNLLKSGWRAIYDRLQIARIASASDKAKFERAIEDPAPLTMDNARATFGDYLVRPRFHILRGLAEAFVDLDPAYKSHSKVKIGVAGLPKRVILSNVGSYSSWGRERLINILNALGAYRGQPLVEHAEMRELDDLHRFDGHRAGVVAFDGHPLKIYRNGEDEEWTPPARGVTVRKFQNGNAHVIFDKPALADINRALAEFYGEVLPDVEDEDAPRRPGTAVAADLQFYPTPAAVAERVLDEAGITKVTEWNPVSLRILEPSCGDGRLMDAIRARGHRPFGVEVDPSRAAAARAKGHPVITANFLEYPPVPEFDCVFMNPPFFGTHWRRHVLHALKFLKPSGRLIAILPATAHYDHGIKGTWHDLPVASFAESGTNVPTGFVIMPANPAWAREDVLEAAQ